MHARMDIQSSYLSIHTLTFNVDVALVAHIELYACGHTPVPLLKACRSDMYSYH